MDSVKDVQSVILSEEDVAMETDNKISNVSETVGDCLGAEFSNTNSKSEANDAIIESQPQDVDDTLGMKNDGEMEISEAVDIEQLVPENEIIEFAIDKKVDMEEKSIVSEISTCDTVVESLVMKKDDSPATINLTKANEIEKDETGINLSGNRLSQEQFDLFNNAFTAINKAPLDDNSLNEIATTVFTNVTEKDLHIFCTEIGAQVLWKILGYAKPTLFQKISKMLYKNISIISKDVYAYFAMNQLIQIAFLRCATEESPEVLSSKKNKDDENDDEFDVFYYNLKKPFPNNHKKFCMDFIERVGKHLLKNLDDYIYDSSGNHLLRGCLICLSGKAKTIKDKQNSSQCIEIKAVLKMTVPQLWSRVLRSIAVRIYKMPVMLDFQNNELTTELLRTLLGSLGIGHPKFVFVYGINLLLKYFSEIDASTNLPKVFSNELSLSLMYTVLQVGDEKLMKYYYSKLFMVNLTPLCTTANTKWAVEKLLETCKDKVIFADIYEKVSRMLSNLINIGNTGIIMELAKGCRRLCCRQKSFVQQMGEALNCSGENSNKFLACLLKLVPLELIANYDDTFIHIHGAVIICEILQFKNPYKLVRSFLEMEKVDIAKIFCNPKGAFICDALMQSESIPGMIQLKFIHERLKGEYTKLAVSRYGLVCLKAIFEAAPNKYREFIMEELANSFDDLNNTPSCKRIISMFNIELYKLENRLWKQKYLRKIHQNDIEMDISGEGNLLVDDHNDAEDDENDK